MINDYRHVGLIGYKSHDQSNRQTYFEALGHHLFYTLVHLVGIDILTFPLFRLAPRTLGSPYLVGGDYHGLCLQLSRAYGPPVWAVKVFWTIVLGSINYHGLAVVWHILALAGIALGIWQPRQYPKFMDKPWLSASLNEFWGRRYHQAMRVSAKSEASFHLLHYGLVYRGIYLCLTLHARPSILDLYTNSLLL